MIEPSSCSIRSLSQKTHTSGTPVKNGQKSSAITSRLYICHLDKVEDKITGDTNDLATKARNDMMVLKKSTTKVCKDVLDGSPKIFALRVEIRSVHLSRSHPI
ncbi:hypothetical protein BDR04DRAFT_1086899 [Suillus decipiens]|nr:hypothetical protein BDR04DRAFT_1086899 [Suillus decipiens]